MRHASVPALLLLALTACSAPVAGEDLIGAASTSDPADPPDTPDPAPDCVGRSPTCRTGERLYTTDEACRSGQIDCRHMGTVCGVDYWCGGAIACTARPSCDANDAEVEACASGAACYTRTRCATTILCQPRPIRCTALPTCDPGDVPYADAESCKVGSCYSRTVCGTTIWCGRVD